MMEFEHRLTEVEERSKSNKHRLDDVEKRQDKFDELVSAVNVLAVREQTVETTVNEIKADVKILTQKPADMWDKAMSTIVTVIISAVVGYILANIGL